MDISTNAMACVCAVAEHLNFRKAAHACHTSQPNLSTHIKNVESELGIQIFERSNKFVNVTPLGRNVVDTFRRTLNSLDALATSSRTDRSPLTIGLFPTLAPYILPDLMMHLRDHCPELKLTIVEDKTARIIQQLDNGGLDCILAATPITGGVFEQQVVFDDVFYVAVPTSDPLAKRSNVAIDELKERTILLLEDGHCLRDQSLDICRNDQLPVDFSYQSTSLETLRAMVAGGMGCSFFPKICIDHHPLISYLSISGSPYSRQIALFWRKSSDSNKALNLFRNTLKNTSDTWSRTLHHSYD